MNTISHGGAELARAVEKAYQQGQTDYYLEPMVRVDGSGRPVGTIGDGDAVIFCCRRGEREIELTDMFVDPDFSAVERRFLPHLDFCILTLYHDKFKHLPVAFAPARVEKPLAQVLSEHGKTQLHCAESEKYAHVTFFFNGGRNDPFDGETDVCVPSPRGVPFDTVPALSLPQVVERARKGLGEADFIVVNFANGDVIGHTSSTEAKLRAAEAVSSRLKTLVHDALAKDYVVLITADHGNIETLCRPNGQPHVAHTRNQVPFLALDPRTRQGVAARDGILADVAPTVLHAMGIPKPGVMTGQTLTPDHDYGGERRVLLMILDGWGLGTKDDNDAIHLAKTPYWDELLGRYPSSRLDASGEAVGLCAGKAGNSEAGHMNLGAGRTVPQDDMRLESAMADGTFAANPVFVEMAERARDRRAALHLLSYLTRASSHGSIDYPLALVRMAKEAGLEKVFLHIIFDGRSTEPGSAPQLLRELEGELNRIGAGQIADGVGRGLALDRDGNYDKVKKAYDAMVLGTGTPCGQGD